MDNNNNILNKRTMGEWECGYGDSSNAFGIFTKKMLDEGLEESPICLISPIEKLNEVDKANAAFICKAVNNYDSLLEALNLVVGSMSLERVERFDILEKCKAAIQKAEQ